MENLYELTLLNKIDLSETEAKKLLSRIEQVIKGKGKLIKTSDLGKRQLAYRIKKQTEGSYQVLDLELDSTVVSSLSQKLSMEESVLRYLILRKEEMSNKSVKKTKDTKPEEHKVTKVSSRKRAKVGRTKEVK